MARTPSPRRTAVSESELNSWFAYRAQPLLPEGMTEPQITIVGDGKVSGAATVDLDAVGEDAAQRARLIDPWSLLGGRLPVTVSGVLHTQNGRAGSSCSGGRSPACRCRRSLLQELVSYYSRTADHPQRHQPRRAVRAARDIRQIEVGRVRPSSCSDVLHSAY